MNWKDYRYEEPPVLPLEALDVLNQIRSVSGEKQGNLMRAWEAKYFKPMMKRREVQLRNIGNFTHLADIYVKAKEPEFELLQTLMTYQHARGYKINNGVNGYEFNLEFQEALKFEDTREVVGA